MRAVRIQHALKCPSCYEIIDPEQHGDPQEARTWRCTNCGHCTDDGPQDVARCGHDPPEIVMEQCPECEVWQSPQELKKRKECPLCNEWIDPWREEFVMDADAYRCGECEEISQDRDEAMECCT